MARPDDLAHQVEPERGPPAGLGGRLVAQGAFHLAALQVLADGGAERALERAQLFGEAQRDLEIAVVDGAKVAGRPAPRPARGFTGVTRHAVCHPRASVLGNQASW